MKVAERVLILQRAMSAHVPDFRPLANFYSVQQQLVAPHYEQQDIPATVSNHSTLSDQCDHPIADEIVHIAGDAFVFQCIPDRWPIQLGHSTPDWPSKFAQRPCIVAYSCGTH